MSESRWWIFESIARGRFGITRITLCTAALLAASTVVELQPAVANTVHVSTTETWVPTSVPLPATLPDGVQPSYAVLSQNSCVSPTSCVAVGYVSGGGTYPLIETLGSGGWSAYLAPLPQGYASDGSGATYASLTSVSCTPDGGCSAVGDYQEPGGSQVGLIETLSSGVWTATEAPSSAGTNGGVVNLRSVSCVSATVCTAVGDYSDAGSFSPVVYSFSDGGWTIQSAPVLPSNYGSNLVLASVACPDAADCVAVGSYSDTASSSQGLVLTFASGTWSASEAPLPQNAVAEPAVSNLAVLDSVDCVDASDCVAGGAYIDDGPTGAAGNSDPMLLTLQSGAWSASAAPVPTDAAPGQGAIVTSVSCPSLGACNASGVYATDANGDTGGMQLTESGSLWTAADGTAPSSPVTVNGTSGPSDVCAVATQCSFAGAGSGTGSQGASGPGGGAGSQAPVTPSTSSDLVGISCTTAKFCASVDDVGDAFVFQNSNTQGTPNWAEFPGVATLLAGVSCKSGTFCEAVGSSNAYAWNGSSWSATSIDSTGNKVLAISCPASNFCMAVDSGGYAIKYSGTSPSWKTPVSVDSGNSLQAISCTASTFCMAVDAAGNPVKYYSGTWTKQSTLSGSPDLLSVGCGSTTFCLAGDKSGNTWKWNGSSWNGPFATTNNEAVNGLSCVNTSFCWAVDNGGHALSWNNANKNWTSYPVDNSPLEAVSCPVNTFCATTDDVGSASMYSSTGWMTTNVDKSSQINTISCTGSSFCAATDQNGDGLTVTNGDIWTWSISSQLTLHSLDALSCSSATFCIGVDTGGNAFEWTGSSWLLDASVTTNSLSSVTCVASNFCDAGDSTGKVWTSTNSGSSWSSATVSTASITGISCASSSFCEAVDSSGNAWKWNGTKWSTAIVLGGGKPLTAIDCPSSTACEAVNNAGYAFKYSSSWGTSGTDIDGSHDLTSVSCIASGSCYAVDNVGDVVHYKGSWTTPLSIDTNALTSVGCTAQSFCAASDAGGNVLTLDGTGNWSSPQAA
jgi:hypothetical protein